MALEQGPKFTLAFRALPTSPTWLIHSTLCFLFFRGPSSLNSWNTPGLVLPERLCIWNVLSNLLPTPIPKSLSSYMQLIWGIQTFIPCKGFFLTSSPSSPAPGFLITLVMINLREDKTSTEASIVSISITLFPSVQGPVHRGHPQWKCAKQSTLPKNNSA